MVWHYEQTDGQYHNISAFSSKSAGMKKSSRLSQSLGEHRPSLQTLYCTPHQHGQGSTHTSPAPVTQSTPPHQVFTVPTRWPSEALGQTPSPGLQKPCRVSCWQLGTSLAASWLQDCVCCASAWDEAKLGIFDWHQLSDDSGIANSVRSSLIWVCTICICHFVRNFGVWNFRTFIVYLKPCYTTTSL